MAAKEQETISILGVRITSSIEEEAWASLEVLQNVVASLEVSAELSGGDMPGAWTLDVAEQRVWAVNF